VEGLKFQGLFYKFPEKNQKIRFSGIIFGRKIGVVDRAGLIHHGPRRPGPPWTGDHCRVPELIGARPPAALVAGVAGRGAEEGKGSTGVPVLGSPGLRRRWSGGASVNRAPVRVTRGSEMGQGGAVRGEDARAPFYRVGGGVGRPGGGGGAP
jgi:hypothetical protein